ncbi:adenosylcobinamide-phosphate synthase CbiB [Colwellia sp. PAMC 21821]|uniref:adenosylcobinamide-phosphate synthase CbiB n=1 Tax=Colwellia sp. PAMC 21821 TaxID=1816219 RepID=UPI001E5BC227|nr:adenosylcobinamide-phosphate synthase CbiB [Colwellia sp. PAMC 21821]
MMIALTDNVINDVLLLLPEFTVFFTLFLALILDKFLGEAKHFHYLVGFGYLANKLEAKFNPTDLHSSVIKTRLLGISAWGLLVLPLPIIYFYLLNDLTWYWQVLLDAYVLYLCLGLNSLYQHALQIYRPLKSGDLDSARHFTGYIVSRETSALTEQEMSRATVESMLENGHDAVIASLIYYVMGGAPLVILHRFANTLDAMWGYKTSRYQHFGYASARLDDLLGFISGKCCVLLYALQGLARGRFRQAILNALQQGNKYKSHNGGWVMAAGATVLGIKLGGSALYHGKVINSVTLGSGQEVTADDIPKSLRIVSRASLLFLAAVLIFQMIIFR